MAPNRSPLRAALMAEDEPNLPPSTKRKDTMQKPESAFPIPPGVDPPAEKEPEKTPFELLEAALAPFVSDLQKLGERMNALEKAKGVVEEAAKPLPGTPKDAKGRLERLEEAVTNLLSIAERGAGVNEVKAAKARFEGR